MSGKRVAFYCRVSTDGQSVENQVAELTAVAERHGWQVVEIYTDEGISGAKGRDKRPGFNDLCKSVTQGKIDMVAAWSVDRLGRSFQDLATFLTELHAKDVDLYLHQQGLDTSTPAGRAMFGMMAVFAEFEREMITARTKAGIDRARAKGKRIGRPPVKPRVVARIRDYRDKGLGIRKIAGLVGVGNGTAARVCREYDDEQKAAAE